MSDKIKKDIAKKKMRLSILFCVFFTMWGILRIISKNEDIIRAMLAVAIYGFCGFFGFQLAYEKMEELLFVEYDEPFSF